MTDDNASEINPGDVVTVRTDPGFSNAAGDPVDPAAVSLVWYRKGEPPTTWVYPSNILHDVTGTYSAVIPVDKAGTYYYRWVGAGGVDAAAEASFTAVSSFEG